MARVPSLIWGLVAGLAGSLCCIGPSAAILFGLGSSSALFGWSINRSLALAFGGTLLVVGGALALRRRATCTTRPALRRSLALLLGSFALVYALVGWLAPSVAARQLQADPAVIAPAPMDSTTRRLTVSVAKMECPPCVEAVRGLLARQPYVSAWFAEPYIDTVTIDYDSASIDAEQLVKLFPAKFDLQLISDTPLP